jgi:hypothetical protein
MLLFLFDVPLPWGVESIVNFTAIVAAGGAFMLWRYQTKLICKYSIDPKELHFEVSCELNRQSPHLGLGHSCTSAQRNNGHSIPTTAHPEPFIQPWVPNLDMMPLFYN